MREAYVRLEFFVVDAMAYCERHGLLPDAISGQIDLFRAGVRNFRPSRDADSGLWLASLDAPSGGREDMIVIVDEFYLVCVGIVNSASIDPPDQIEQGLQDVSYQQRISVAYGELIRLRRHGSP